MVALSFFRPESWCSRPSRCARRINVLRAKYDPQSHKNVEAHVSLTVPLQKEPDDHQWAGLERIGSQFQAFPISYGPLVPFLPRPGAALDIQPKAQLDNYVSRWKSARFFLGLLHPDIHSGRI
jgi:hypothetical protein